jgi:O-antigen ligase/tetratricopeptide (TPR) repeat protein
MTQDTSEAQQPLDYADHATHRRNRRVRVVYDVIGVPRTRFDVAVEILLAAMLLFMPAAFGAVEPWSEMVVVVLAAALAMCLLGKLIEHPQARLIGTWAYLPIAVFLTLVLLQLAPLPSGVLALLSPNTAATKTRLLGDLSNAAEVLRRTTITFYGEATWRDLTRLLAVVAVFVVVVNMYQRLEPVRRLLATIAIVGGAMALLALAQDALGARKIYWSVPTYFGLATSGTFVNHSHFAQFMNLSMGGGLALLLLYWHEHYAKRHLSAGEVFEQFGNRDFTPVWLLGAMLALGAASVAFSLSRGGVIAMGAAAIVTALVIAIKARVRTSTLAFTAALAAIIAVAVFFGSEAVSRRMASLREPGAEGSRLQILRDLARAWREYPLFGTGLGTHRYVFPMFDTSRAMAAVATHAENEYAQVAEETGGVGLAMVALLVGIVMAAYARCVRGHRSSAGAVAVGLGFGVLAVLIHSASDFGQHVFANAMLLAISFALILNMARLRSRERDPDAPPVEPIRGRRWLRITAAAMTLAVFAGMIWQSATRVSAASAWQIAARDEATLRERGWRTGDDGLYAELIGAAARASAQRPGDVGYRYWLNVYRWQSLDRYRDSRTGTWPPERRDVILQFTRGIVAELQTCRVLCPTFGPAYAQLGLLKRFELGDASGAAHIRLGYELAPNDPTANYADGLLAAQEGDWSRAVARFRQSVALGSGALEPILDLLIYEHGRPDVALEVARDRLDSVELLIAKLESAATTRPENVADVLQQARAEEKRLLLAAAQRGDADPPVIARAAQLRAADGRLDEAIQLYRRAITGMYEQPQWHLELARLLARSGRSDEAAREASVALRLHPGWPEARQLLKELESPPR